MLMKGKSMKKKLTLIAGFYKNESPEGLGLRVREDDLDRGHTLDWMAEQIDATVAQMTHTGAEVKRQLEQFLVPALKKKVSDMDMVSFFSCVQYLEQKGEMKVDNTNGMLYQNEWIR
jgi:hypothetical protein